MSLLSNPAPCWVRVDGVHYEGVAFELAGSPGRWQIRVRYVAPNVGVALDGWFDVDEVEVDSPAQDEGALRSPDETTTTRPA